MAYQYGRHLADRGHSVTFLLLENRIDQKHSSAQVIVLGSTNIRSSLLRLLTLSFKPRTVFISIIPHFTLVFRLARALRLSFFDRVVYTVHNNIQRDFGAGWKDRMAGTAYMWLLRRSANVYAVSNALVQSLIPLGISARPLINKTTYRTKFVARGGDRTTWNIVMAGRLTAQKDYKAAIRFLGFARELGITFTVDIYGEGPLREELETEISRASLSDFVRFKGYREDLEQVLEDPNYNLLLLTSAYEGFGLVIVEAIAKNLFPVARDCDFGPRELLARGVGHLLPFSFDKADVEASYNAWVEWMSMPVYEQIQRAELAIQDLQGEVNCSWQQLESYQ